MFSRSQLNRDFAGVLGINNSVQKTSFVTCQLRCHMKTCFKFYNWRIHSINVVFNSSSICDLERDTSRQNFKHTGQHNKGGVIHIHNHHLVLVGHINTWKCQIIVLRYFEIVSTLKLFIIVVRSILIRSQLWAVLFEMTCTALFCTFRPRSCVSESMSFPTPS